MDELIETVLKTCRTARDFTVEFVAAHTKLAVGQTVNELFFIAVTIVSRAVRHQDAIELLLREHFTAEASIIGLTQFELCLDALYIGDNASRATEWVKHTSTRSAPWRVKDKIDYIWDGNPKMRDAKQACFELLSSVKHGNPTAGIFGFPVRRVGNRFTVTNDKIENVFSQGHAIAVGGVCSCQLIESLEGLSRAFARFVQIDPNLNARRQSVLGECRQEIRKAMMRWG